MARGVEARLVLAAHLIKQHDKSAADELLRQVVPSLYQPS
jgi:hypothetical protein